jgi:hypothetical protein
MSTLGTLIRPVFVIVALVVGTNDAAYWTVYTMDRMETAARSALLALQRSVDADSRTAAAAGGVHRPAGPQPLPNEPDGDDDVPVDPGVGCITDTW